MGRCDRSVVCSLSLSPSSTKTLTDTSSQPFRSPDFLTAPVAASTSPTRHLIPSPWAFLFFLGQSKHFFLGLIQVFSGSFHLFLPTTSPIWSARGRAKPGIVKMISSPLPHSPERLTSACLSSSRLISSNDASRNFMA